MPRRKPPITLKPDAMPVPTVARGTLPEPKPYTPSPSDTSRSTPARPQWEYRVAVSEDGLCYYLRDMGYYQGEPVVSVHFNDLGADGWELVTIYPVGDAMHAPVYYAVFKRVEE